ncbi:MAG: type II secretion system F family protein [Sedimentisphaerales bacterium]|nr:type II secretion system F family protein [Sedimentisphaerales bacterium]
MLDICLLGLRIRVVCQGRGTVDAELRGVYGFFDCGVGVRAEIYAGCCFERAKLLLRVQVMPSKMLSTAYESLSSLLEAGVPLIRSLKTVTAGLRGREKAGFLSVTTAIEKGTPLSEAMAGRGKVFSQLEIMIVGAAEASGNLAESFTLLGKWHEFSRRIRRRLWSGLMLPIFVIHAVAFVVPLPALIIGGFDFGAYFRTASRVLAVPYLIAAVIIGIIVLTPQTGIARRMLDRISLRIPALGRGIYYVALSRYCWVFHMTCKAGMPMTECADMALKVVGNAVVVELFRPTLASVKAGNAFSEGLNSKLPPEFLEPWRIAEETGKLDEVSERLAVRNGEKAEFWFREFAIWFPRVVYLILMIVLAIIVIRQFMSVYIGALSA